MDIPVNEEHQNIKDNCINEAHDEIKTKNQENLLNLLKEEKKIKKDIKKKWNNLPLEYLLKLQKYVDSLMEEARSNRTLKGPDQKFFKKVDRVKEYIHDKVCGGGGNGEKTTPSVPSHQPAPEQNKLQNRVAPETSDLSVEHKQEESGNGCQTSSSKKESKIEKHTMDLVRYEDIKPPEQLSGVLLEKSKTKMAETTADFLKQLALITPTSVRNSESCASTSSEILNSKLSVYKLDLESFTALPEVVPPIEAPLELSLTSNTDIETAQDEPEQQMDTYGFNYTESQEKDEEKHKQHEERIERLVKEIKDLEKETDEIQKKTERNREALNEAFFQCISQKQHFEEEEEKCEQFLNTTRVPIANVKSRFKLTEKLLKNSKKKDYPDVLETELPFIHKSALYAYKTVNQGWVTVKNLCGMFPDKIFLFIIQRELVTVSEKLFDILTELDLMINGNEGSLEQLHKLFSHLDPMDILSTCQLREQSKTEKQDTLKFDLLPKIYEELSNTEIEDVSEIEGLHEISV